MRPKRHPIPLSGGGDRKALSKELRGAQVTTTFLAERSAELHEKGQALIREADDLPCQSWNERMRANGRPVDPSPFIEQAINGGDPMREIECSRCRTPRTVNLAELKRPATTYVHDLIGRLVCTKCRQARKRPAARLKQLAPRGRHG
jgi:hypothetical protein